MLKVIFKGKIMTLIQNDHVSKIFFNSLINQLLGTDRVLRLLQMRVGLRKSGNLYSLPDRIHLDCITNIIHRVISISMSCRIA